MPLRRSFALSFVAVTAMLVGVQPALARGHSQRHRGGRTVAALRRLPNALKTPVPAGKTTTLGPTSGPQLVQGVVQQVSAKAVVLRQLDGTVVSVPVDRKTQIFVDNRPAQLAAVRPGYVVTASWAGGKAATALRFLRSG
jgi:hypothetical protein